ncbi:MAG: CBS domain-containing protein [Candidatus Bilamarchaeaceae archaeon]
MRMLKANVIDGEEPLSKALNLFLTSGTAAVVTKEGRYYGIIDDRNIRQGITDASRTKAISAAVRAPSLPEDASLDDAIRAFMAGHFKALPVVRSGRIVGLATRAEVMEEMLKEKMVPKTRISALMSSPLYTIEEDEELGVARTMMKKLNVHRLAVTRGKRVVGVVSTFDISASLLKPSGRDRFMLVSEITNPDMKPVRDFMRTKFVIASASDPLGEAVRKMAKENISDVIVMEGENPAGILSAVDVMKFVLGLISEGPVVYISGLGEDEMAYYGEIKEAVKGALKKFGKTFEIGDVQVHFKKGKSVYSMNTHVDIGGGSLIVNSEGYDLKTAVDANVNEIKMLLTKRKGYADMRKRYAEGFYEGPG